MASKSELLQAQAFNRRRLQRAFVSGAPGGRELAPGKPLRGVVVSVALGVLTVIVSLLIGTFTGSLPKDWRDGAIIVVQGEGSRYVALDGTLYPVKNLASARLLVGSAKITSVPAGKLDGISRDPSPVGIDGAPDYLPAPDRQYDDPWLSCVAADYPLEISTRLLGDSVGSDDQGALVRDDSDRYWFIQGDRRYAVADDNVAVVASVFLGIDDVSSVPSVSGLWLNLVSPGSPLAVDLGGELGEDADTAGLLIGQAVQTQSDGKVVAEYVADGDGRLVPATAFARQLFTAYVGVEPAVMTVAEATDLVDVNSDAIPADWPESVPAPSADGSTACLQMTPAADGPLVSVATAPDDLEPGTRVTPGAGAAITSRSKGEGSTFGFVSEAGVYFPVESAEDMALLGYAAEESVTVPTAWTQLLEQGPTLSRAIAQSTASGQAN
ncbi:type VII secretion protein EccB [Microbacterium sp. W4I20]|jgi:type VII secretion protein EccB|uniref:type VII secretion protein EccB n=1 Tax=Microbacterium sp. W4I20 TaxID=3042262 RepID=UPI002784A30D|nr:type VII secretion protein EccB [Microbacterium sp. W4I20]MDQ0726917.1 type VII secretion protein EccB [Microbacterium sp. W4I20]